ncbi:MAG TPA: aldo/keto reductase [Allosphingosinicella sp.]|jgi:aryl-alcohol dehydrogenase-like predicted oxidoreductase
MRILGRSGLETPPLIFGGNVFGWTADEKTSFDLLDRFVGAGGTMIDTADTYAAWVPGNVGGESETIIGNWLKRRGRRDDVLIATKVGFDGGLGAANIARAIDGSLKRLGTDYVDLYYAHRDDAEVPLEETLEAFDALVRAGKVRALGASQISADRLEQAMAIAQANGWFGYSVLQTWYSLVERPRYEEGLRDVVGRRGLGMCAFFALANGYLTGKYRSAADLGKSVRGDRVEDYVAGNGPRVLAALDEVARDTKATPAQVALAWTAAQPTVTAPLASARTVEQLDELLGSLDLTLSRAQIDALNAASAERAA